jgi:hypothetical protein
MRRSLLRLRLVYLACLALALAPATARADGEVWLWAETRVPVVRAERPAFPRVDWRIFTDVRMNARNDGLHQSFLRSGPLLFATDFLFVGLHGTVYADRQATGVFGQEARIELEPNFFFRWGDFAFNDRNRGELRFRSGEQRTRYRNQLRVSYAPKGARWIPFVWDELLVDLAGQGVHQNRFQTGLGRMLDERTRLDVGYMFRSRKEQGSWSHDHILNVSIFFDAPRAPKPAPP